MHLCKTHDVQVYIYVHINIDMHVYVLVHIYMCLHICIRIHTCICVYIYIHVYLYTYIHIYIYTYTHMYTHIHSPVYVYGPPEKPNLTNHSCLRDFIGMKVSPRTSFLFSIYIILRLSPPTPPAPPKADNTEREREFPVVVALCILLTETMLWCNGCVTALWSRMRNEPGGVARVQIYWECGAFTWFYVHWSSGVPTLVLR